MQNPFGNGNNDDDDNNNNMIPIPPNYATVSRKSDGQIRIAKVGFSWTSFLFPLCPPIFRSDWYNFLCMLGIELIAMMGISLLTGQPLNVVEYVLYYPFAVLWGAIYNMMYFKHLFKIGFEPADERSQKLLEYGHYLNKKDDNDQN